VDSEIAKSLLRLLNLLEINYKELPSDVQDEIDALTKALKDNFNGKSEP